MKYDVSYHHHMVAVIHVGGKVLEFAAGGTIESAMLSQGAHPDSFIYLKSGVPVPMDTPLEDGMVVKAIKVASGG